MAEPDTMTPTAASPPPESVFSRVRRLGGYAAWSAAAFALPIALDRLVVCPVLKRHLGEDVFGGFVWLLGVINVFSLATGAGFTNHLMRDLAHHSREGAQRLLRTTFTLSTGLVTVILLAGGFGSYWLADEVVRSRAAVLYGPLCLFGLVRCVGAVAITDLRIRRRFATAFGLKAIEAAVLLAVLWIAPWRNLALIGTLYVASVAFPLIVGGYLIRDSIGRGAWWDRTAAARVMTAWPVLAASSLIEQALVYSPRIVLGALDSSAAVTVLFAGTSINNVFTMPVGLAGGLVLSLLASKRDFALRGRVGGLYLGMCFVTGTVIGLASFFIGRLLVQYLYPDTAPQTLTFYHWIALAGGCTAVIVLIRPVVLKYARVRIIAALSAGTLLLQLALLIVVVPLAGAAGAAGALAFSSFLSMTLWVSCFAVLKRRADNTESDENAMTQVHGDVGA